MGKPEIEIKFECMVGTRSATEPMASTVVIVVRGQRDVEKSITWAREQFNLDAEEYVIVEVKNGRFS